jgi:hypothetical protein
MGDHADDAIHEGIDQGWGFRRIRAPRRLKPTNQEVFANFARATGEFKPGDRVKHIQSGTTGTITGIRNGAIYWKPDSRLKPGDVFIDADKLMFDI